MKKSSNIFVFLSVACILLIASVYYLGSLTVENPDTNLAARNIESTPKLWLNGYFSLFFNFKYLGNLNWLLIPLGIFYLKTKRFKLKREQWAMLLFFSLAFGLVALKGYFNPRYSFTLLSLSVFLVFALVFILSEQTSKRLSLASLSFLFLLILFNTAKSVGFEDIQKLLLKISEGDKTIYVESIEGSNDGVKIVTSVLEEIESGEYGETFLVNNCPDFYYHTSKKGLYYWAGDDHFYSPEGRTPLFDKYNFKQVHEFFQNESCSYIYTHASYLGYHDLFDQFLEEECDLILADSKRQLYKIKDA